MIQVKLSQLKIAGLRDLQIRWRSQHDGDRRACALDDACLIGAHEAVGCSLGEGALEQPTAKALRLAAGSARRAGAC